MEKATIYKPDEYFYDLTENPKDIMKKGICVPLWYLCWYLNTYGCNNWRKLRGLPMIRRAKNHG